MRRIPQDLHDSRDFHPAPLLTFSKACLVSPLAQRIHTADLVRRLRLRLTLSSARCGPVACGAAGVSCSTTSTHRGRLSTSPFSSRGLSSSPGLRMGAPWAAPTLCAGKERGCCDKAAPSPPTPQLPWQSPPSLPGHRGTASEDIASRQTVRSA